MAKSTVIQSVRSFDARYPLAGGAGSDAVHTEPEYCLAVTCLGNSGFSGTGIVLTLGEGNRIVCELIDLLSEGLCGREIEAVMADFGAMARQLANHPQLRWLGPHKGAVHLALASITNACFDLWAKARGVPLWRLLLDLTPDQIVCLLDLSYLEDVLTAEDVRPLLTAELPHRAARESILESGYPGYDTSVGWIQYDDETVRDKARRALDNGFRAFKLKVGSADPQRDIRRAYMLREMVGDDSLVMLDVNQQWTYPQSLTMCESLRKMSPYWIEEPTHPDDVFAHKTLAAAVAPTRLALGEHVPNRVIFKAFLQAQCAGFIQVDAVRVAGVSEFLAVSLMCKRFGVPVVPHVGDMGQLHQHLVLFNRVGIGHDEVFLEYIPHLRRHFTHPCAVENGSYRPPQVPGATCDLLD